MGKGRSQRGLIDTDVLRAYRLGDPDTLSFLSDLANLRRLDISRLSAMVFVADAPDTRERNGLNIFFSWCDIHGVTARIAGRALRILEILPPSAPVTADDAIIAATATEHKLPLYTLDSARFAAVPGLTAIKPY